MLRTSLTGATLTVALAFAQPATAASSSLVHELGFAAVPPAGLQLDNLLGDVRVVTSEAAGFSVTVTVTAEAASPAAASALATAVRIASHDRSGDSSLQVEFPEDTFPVLYWPEAPSGWLAGRMYVDYLGRKRRLTGDRDDGVVVRADIVVRAPAGSRLAVRNVLGDSAAEGFSGDLVLDGRIGRLRSSRGNGKLSLDSGRGDVEVDTHEGEVVVDTGSGPVTIRDCTCRIEADTGSGSIRIEGGSGRLEADTGSGNVQVDGFAGSIVADTGSGNVLVRGLAAATEFVADTGSGSVRVAGDLSQLTHLDVDTGSGSVSVDAVAWPAMRIVIDTGSGAVTADIPGAERSRDTGRRTVLRIGEGTGRGAIESGSGSVRLRTVGVPAAE